MSTDDNDDYKEPRFPIAKEDIGPLIGGALMSIMTVAIMYYVYIGPSPFEAWFSKFKEPVAASQPKPAASMMPAEAVSGVPSGATSGGAGARTGVSAPDAGTEASETPETPEKAK